MKKRLTAWLLVLCMALSLLPGTAFAAEGGGSGKATITYDLNDDMSHYQLQLKTDSGQAPDNQPGAVWQGRPFAGWVTATGGTPQYTDGEILYAKWLGGFEVTLHFDDTTQDVYTAELSGKLSDANLGHIDDDIEQYSKDKNKAFDGWYTDKDTWKEPFELTAGTNIKADVELYARWVDVYTITFKYNNNTTRDLPLKTGRGGTLTEEPVEPVFTGYTFGGWYIKTGPDTPGAVPIEEGNLASAVPATPLMVFQSPTRRNTNLLPIRRLRPTGSPPIISPLMPMAVIMGAKTIKRG